jgi:diaminopimelate decarboxylase
MIAGLVGARAKCCHRGMPRARHLLRASKQHVKSLLRPLLASPAGAPAAFTPETWRLSRGAGGGLLLQGVPLDALLERFGSPLFVVDAEKLRDNARAFQRVPAGEALGCEVFYSYKTNPVPGVLRMLHAEGVGAEVISEYELWLACRLGVPPARIVYNGPGKSDASLRTAVELGVEIINCNHREEIARVAAIARTLGKRARIGIRIGTEQSWSGQFGTPIAGGHAFAAFEAALADDALELIGLHAHRGGMMRTEGELVSFVSSVLAFAKDVEERLGVRFQILNFGGSLGLNTVGGINPRDHKLNQAFHRDMPLPAGVGLLGIDRYVERLLVLVNAHYRAVGRERPRVFVEPGRGMTGDTQLLLARVLTTKDLDGIKFTILDAGINVAESVRNEYHQLLPVNRFGRPATRVHSLVGPICSPGDTLYPAIRLPELFDGDSVAIMDAGAYFVPFSTSFSFPKPAIALVDGGETRLIRRRETFEDLVRYDELPQ